MAKRTRRNIEVKYTEGQLHAMGLHSYLIRGKRQGSPVEAQIHAVRGPQEARLRALNAGIRASEVLWLGYSNPSGSNAIMAWSYTQRSRAYGDRYVWYADNEDKLERIP